MKVAKWGNSLAIRIPASVAEALELKEGDDVTVHVAGQYELGIDRGDKQALIQRLRKYRGLLPADFKFDREEANAR